MTNDPGKHYRGRFLGPYVVDPYRIEALYPNITSPSARHMLKKLLRFGDKGHSEQELIAELQSCLNRWNDMLAEDVLLKEEAAEREQLDDYAQELDRSLRETDEAVDRKIAAEPAQIPMFHDGWSSGTAEQGEGMSKSTCRLVDLEPSFVGHGGDGITRKGQMVPRREGVGIMCNCPCGGCGVPFFVYFANPLDGGPPVQTAGPNWQRTGETFETLTVSPSVQRIGGCEYHGWLRNGVFERC